MDLDLCVSCCLQYIPIYIHTILYITIHAETTNMSSPPWPDGHPSAPASIAQRSPWEASWGNSPTDPDAAAGAECPNSSAAPLASSFFATPQIDSYKVGPRKKELRASWLIKIYHVEFNGCIYGINYKTSFEQTCLSAAAMKIFGGEGLSRCQKNQMAAR